MKNLQKNWNIIKETYLKKIVILTGACGNFGSFISKQLIKNKEIIPVLITSKKIKKKNYHQIDIKKKESIVKIFLYIRKKYGEPDVLINNAAVNTLKGFNDFVKNSKDERIIDTYIVNSISSLLFIKYFFNLIQCHIMLYFLMIRNFVIL